MPISARHAFCRQKANPALARRYAGYFTEGYDAYGVDYKDPDWKANQTRWEDALRQAGGAVWLDAGDLLVRTGKYEEASFAVLFAIDLGDLHTEEAWRRIGGWFDGGIRNWGHTDVLSQRCLTQFLRHKTVKAKALEAWVKSPFKFQRRAVPVTLIGLLKTAPDYAPFFRLITPLMDDAERVVHQGAGWFLREAWKLKPAETEAFLLKHKDACPRLIVQYATEKMTPEQKARFRRTKG